MDVLHRCAALIIALKLKLRVFLELGCHMKLADSPMLVRGALMEEGWRGHVGEGSCGGLSVSVMLTMVWECRLPGLLPSLSDRHEPYCLRKQRQFEE